MTDLYLVHYQPGPAWVPDTPVFQQPLQAHRQYMGELFTRGSLRVGGPFTDNTGGAIVLRPLPGESVQALIDADPAVRDGIMVARAHPWHVLAGADVLLPRP